MDLNMPRDKETGKPRGFGFLMYEDQRSTVLAVDNLNGAKVLDRTLRVDHVKNYKQPKAKGEDGEWVEPDEQSMNARPQLIGASSIFVHGWNTPTEYMCMYVRTDDGADSDSSASSGPAIDPEDPMAEFLLAQRKEQKALKKSKSKKSKGKHKDETPEERRTRKAKKAAKKAKKAAGKSEVLRGVEDLLASLGGGGAGMDDGIGRRRSSRSRTPPPRRRDDGGGEYSRSRRSRSRSRSRSPPPMRGPARPYARDGRGGGEDQDPRSKKARREYN